MSYDSFIFFSTFPGKNGVFGYVKPHMHFVGTVLRACSVFGHEK